MGHLIFTLVLNSLINSWSARPHQTEVLFISLKSNSELGAHDIDMAWEWKYDEAEFFSPPESHH